MGPSENTGRSRFAQEALGVLAGPPEWTLVIIPRDLLGVLPLCIFIWLCFFPVLVTVARWQDQRGSRLVGRSKLWCKSVAAAGSGKGEADGLLRQGLGVIDYSKDTGPLRNII